MIELFVNEIHEGESATHGLVVLNGMVRDNLRKVYDATKYQKVKKLMNETQGDFFLLDHFCQFVIYTQFSLREGLSMQITDYEGDIDNALDDYQTLTNKEWRKDDLNRIMMLFQETQKYIGEKAILTVRKPIE